MPTTEELLALRGQLRQLELRLGMSEPSLTGALSIVDRMVEEKLVNGQAGRLTILIDMRVDESVPVSDTEDVEGVLRKLIETWQTDGRSDFTAGESGVIYAANGNTCGGWAFTGLHATDFIKGGA